MLESIPELEITDDGTHTLRHAVFGDLYHSANGALTESSHIFIRNGFEMCEKEHVRILEVGFGTGLNAWLTLKKAEAKGKTVEYTAIELYPIPLSIAQGLCYAEDDDFISIHKTEWEKACQISSHFSLKKIKHDLAEIKFDAIFDLVYFDAFAPDTQPELWSPEIFWKLYDHMDSDSSLVTYSAKGSVKQALREAGFEVKRLPGAPGKRHMIRALK